MYTKGQWSIDGSQIISVERNDETICELNPDTEYPTVFERSKKEAIENAKIIVNAPKMYEAIKEILEQFDGNGVLNTVWIKKLLTEAIS